MAMIQQDEIAVEPVSHCLICNAEGILLHAHLEDHMFGVGGRWNVVVCANPTCHVLWLDPRPCSDEVGKVYRVYYTHKDQPDKKGSWLGRVRRWSQRWTLGERDRKRIRLLSPVLEPPGRLLEIGCGDGARLLALRQHGWMVEGQDIDPASGHLATKAGVTVHFGPLASLQLAPAAYDVIVMNHVIEHVYDPVDLLQRCRILLRKGGRVVSVAPNPRCLGLHWFGRAWVALDVPRHLRLLTPNGYREIAKRAGFTNITVETTSANNFIFASTSLAIRRSKNNSGVKPLPLWCYGEVFAFQLIDTIFSKIYIDVGEECILWAGN